MTNLYGPQSKSLPSHYHHHRIIITIALHLTKQYRHHTPRAPGFAWPGLVYLMRDSHAALHEIELFVLHPTTRSGPCIYGEANQGTTPAVFAPSLLLLLPHHCMHRLCSLTLLNDTRKAGATRTHYMERAFQLRSTRTAPCNNGIFEMDCVYIEEGIEGTGFLDS